MKKDQAIQTDAVSSIRKQMNEQDVMSAILTGDPLYSD